ncbi:hypothetical protein LWI28_013646 [Acer negundo]|uniref:Uncharacterized protein n=1 Tax=Acer negundo TaxID=4023 RepID=A0AAD5IF02_ACENE|nr:hypothetical protein LWI28_013646 [Acer negundo]
MDAEVSVFILMKKFPLMFPTIGDSSFGEQIKNNLLSLNQLLRYAEDSEVSCVGGGVDSMDDDDDDQKNAAKRVDEVESVTGVESEFIVDIDRNEEGRRKEIMLLGENQGFVTPSITEKLDRENLEEICLEELVIRNMVEVRWRLDGTPKKCCMPNFLYEFFSRKAANAGFFYQHLHQFSPECSGLPKLAVWRLAAYLGIKHFPYSQRDILNLLTRLSLVKASDC